MKALTSVCLLAAVVCAVPQRRVAAQNFDFTLLFLVDREPMESRQHVGPLSRTTQSNSDTVHEAWVVHYSGPASNDVSEALAIDGSGNVYVTGRSYDWDTDYDYATIKYSSDGMEQWVGRYNDPGNGWDQVADLAVDDSGNVYVTGRNDVVSIVGDYVTIKYNSDGMEQWVVRYDGPANSDDSPRALALDGFGNIYVTGWSQGSGTHDDYTTIKYNSDGVEQWVARYDGPVSSADNAAALVVDGSGNVYVAGRSQGSGTSLDYATIKYNSDGVEQWVARYDGPVSSDDLAFALVVDASGNVSVTGWSQGSGTSVDYATIKYNSDGAEQWVARYDGSGNSNDRATDIALDDAGNVYVAGSSLGVGTHDDYTTIKYSPDGLEQWVARYDGPASSLDQASDLVVEASGSVYVTGSSAGSGTSVDFATIRYNTEGVQQWVIRYVGQGDAEDDAAALAVDDFGNVYVTGYSRTGGTRMYTTIKYVQTVVSVKELESSIPDSYHLSQNYPNPFNPSTTIEFSLPHSGYVMLTVYNTLGEEIATLVSENLSAGRYSVDWDASRFSSGIYFYRLQAGEFVETKKLILLR